MTAYYDEPKTVAEMLSRYREVRRRLYPPVIRPATRDFTARDAENTIALVLALTAVAAVRARASQARAEETRRTVMSETPGGKAKAAVRAVSKRTGVPVEEILGRRRVSMIASARHEAIWRVRQVTDWSLPRVGRFFANRDHTTVLHSLRWMENRAARDPQLRAYMAGIAQCRSSPANALGH